ncbi:hypothetical protein A2U01_0019995, partial [Trifolium medium]|nr:hypothetical protein [Trifolium medium]
EDIRKATNNFDEGRDNELALIAFKSNSNMEEGESTNNEFRDNLNEVSFNADDFLDRNNNPPKTDNGLKFVGPSIKGRATGGANNDRILKQGAGLIHSNGPDKPKEGKQPQKRILSKSTAENRTRKGGGSIVSSKSGTPMNTSSAQDNSFQGSSRFSGGSILCCSSIKIADIIQCNEKIRKRRETEVASKLWNTARVFGVGSEDDCVGTKCVFDKTL